MRFNFFTFLFLFLGSVLGAQELSDSTKAIYEKFVTNYGVHIVHTTSTPSDSTTYDYFQIDPIDFPILNLFVKLLDQEFEKYPKGFVRSTGLKIILITRGLKLRRAPVGGLSGGFVIRYNLSFVINRFGDDRDNLERNTLVKEYARGLIQHEFFHSIDQKYNPEMGGDEKTWKALQGDDANFGKGGLDAIKSQLGGQSTLGIEHAEKGYVMAYGKSAPGEDRATIYEYLSVNAQKEKIDKWCLDDEILVRKIAFLKNFIKKLNPSFNDNFWVLLAHNGWDKWETGENK
jgi:hypothetical protein